MLVATDEKSFGQGLIAMMSELRGRAMRLSGNTSVADDLVQDTIERALRFREQYHLGTNLRAWVHQILFSVFVTRYRRVRRERNAMKMLGLDPNAWTRGTTPPSPEVALALTKPTQSTLDALPEGFRTVVIKVDLEQLSYREAADEIGVPIGTVMSRLHRGRKMLADRIAA